MTSRCICHSASKCGTEATNMFGGRLPLRLVLPWGTPHWTRQSRTIRGNGSHWDAGHSGICSRTGVLIGLRIINWQQVARFWHYLSVLVSRNVPLHVGVLAPFHPPLWSLLNQRVGPFSIFERNCLNSAICLRVN
jgi:hypothetical protein